MDLLAEGVLLNDCLLDELVEDGVRLDELAGLKLKVDARLSQHCEVKLRHLELHWNASFLPVCVEEGVPKVADYYVPIVRGTACDIDFIIYGKDLGQTKI